jgi:acid phosphatase
MTLESLPSVEPLESRCLYSVAAPIPRPDHVVIVIEENHSHAHITASADAPYINSLAQEGASFTDYHAVAYPSQPNYIALFSGSTQGVTDSDIPRAKFTAPSLGGQVVAAGLDFAGYSEDLPYTGYSGPSYRGYVRRHNPWSDFRDVPATDNQSLTRFPRPSGYDRLPTVSFVIPNVYHDMHDGTIRQGDDWLRQHLDPYVQWAKTHNSLLVVTWDEDDHTEGNRIPTIIVGDGVEPGAYPQTLNHYSLLRTIEDMYGLARLGAAAQARPIDMIWSAPSEKTTRLGAAADTYVADASPTTNFGRSTGLDVKTASSGALNRDSYFKFDVSALTASQLASVKLRFNATLSATGRVATSVFAVGDTDWSETGMTWNNRPALGQPLGSVTVASTGAFWHEVDVTDYLRAQRAAGKRFVTLALHNPQASGPKIRVNSREAASDRPELVVVRT